MVTTVEAIASEKKWRAESDARTLAEAEAIKVDGARRRAAALAARRLQKEKQIEVNAMKKIAAPPVTNKRVVKKTITRKKK